ncbi:MAG: NACHT domain-containing protein [Streptosporangiaceae bacterium]
MAGSIAHLFNLARATELCGILGFFVTLIDRLIALTRPKPDPEISRNLDKAAEELADAVRDQWRTEEKLRRVQDPDPLPVQWRVGDPLITDHRANITRRRGSGWIPDLDGVLSEAVDVFSRVPSGRLVVVGAPGAGKSVFTLRFTLDLLERRQPRDPVPVIFPLHSWQPLTESLHSWMTGQLATSYPALRAAGPSGRTVASELIRGQRVLPVLDGLDEVAIELRGDAMRQLNMTLDADARIILTCRTTDYEEIVAASDVFTSAAVIELQPLTLDDLKAYLPRTTRKLPGSRPTTHGTKWDPVLARLETQPADSQSATILQVLSIPLMTSLARAIYSDTRADPASMFSERFSSPADLEAHLLASFVPAAFTATPVTDGSPRRVNWDAHSAERWLGFLARHLDSMATRDLQWWRLEDAMPRPLRWLASGVVIWLGTAAVAVELGCVGRWTAWAGIASCGAAGFMSGLAAGTARLPSEPAKGRYLRSLSRRLRYVAVAAVIDAALFATAVILRLIGPTISDLQVVYGTALFNISLYAEALMLGLAAGTILGAAAIARRPAPLTTPLGIRRRFPTLLRRLGYAIGHGLIHGLIAAAVFGVAASLPAGIAVGLSDAASRRLPPGASTSAQLPAGAKYSDLDGLRYVRLRNGSGYIEPLRKIILYFPLSNSPIFKGSVLASPQICSGMSGVKCEAHAFSRVKFFTQVSTWEWNSQGYVPGPIYAQLPNSHTYYVAFGYPDLSARAETWLAADMTPIQGFTQVAFSWMSACLAVGIIGGLIGGLYLWLDLPADTTRAVSPISTLRTDRNAAILRAGVVSSLTALLYMAPRAVIPVPNAADIWRSLPVCLALGLLAGSFTSWLRLQVARIWLAAKGDLPWRVVSFLAEAHRAGVLRQAGAAYQFRHIRLQEQFVARSAAARDD